MSGVFLHSYRVIGRTFLQARSGSTWSKLELNDTGVMVSLLSPASIVRPWINIELCPASIRRVATSRFVIRGCASGN